MNRSCVWPEFIAGSISDVTPPDMPFVRDDWAGMAFDRNMYEDFAPSEVWDAWLRATLEDDSATDICAIQYSTYSERGAPVEVGDGMAGLRAYWLRNGNFMHDHYVFAADGRWVVRLDQDVTLFAGNLAFIGRVVGILGGAEYAEQIMRRDLIGDIEDVVGLEAYVKGLLAPLKRSGSSERLR